MLYSEYQLEILKAVEQGAGNISVDAVPGAGKTTTNIAAARLINTSTLMAAFGYRIRTTLASRIDGIPENEVEKHGIVTSRQHTNVDISTIHTLGLSMLSDRFGNMGRPDSRKYRLIAKEIFQSDHTDMTPEERDDIYSTSVRAKRIVSLILLTQTDHTDTEAMHQMYEKYDVWPSKAIKRAIPEILRRGRRAIEDKRYAVKHGKQRIRIDFDDMLAGPLYYNLEPRNRYEFILVDESQDLNKAQLEILMRHSNGRILSVGDVHQSIYMFAGADSQNYEEIKRRTNAKPLTLPITYRLPTSIAKLANEIYPGIVPRDGAPQGLVQDISIAQFFNKVQPGDMVLSYRNMPVIRAAIRLISMGKPAAVKGREISSMLLQIIDQIENVQEKRGGVNYADFGKYLDTYHAHERQNLMTNGASDRAQMLLNDRVGSVRVCYKNFDAHSLPELRSMIIGLFDDRQAHINLSTIHKAKGLEAKRVYILERGDLSPGKWDKTEEQIEQKNNVHYVAVTRASEELSLVDDEE